MCLAVPGKVIKIKKGRATIDYGSEKRLVLIGDEPVKMGDFVMVQMGIIVKILSKDEAMSSIEAWRGE